FLIIDNSEVFHLGASLKDLGKKWFAFSKMDKTSVEAILNKIEKIK
ncbi:MAG: DNA-binding protein, partial [Bacteroidales bacterium]|nr:DNA-binding protein [Bacteroidales bacterium]